MNNLDDENNLTKRLPHSFSQLIRSVRFVSTNNLIKAQTSVRNVIISF